MSTLDLFSVLGDDSNHKSKSPPRHILKKKKNASQLHKVRRHWPGKAPQYAQESSSSSGDEDDVKVSTAVDTEPDRRLLRYSNTQFGDQSERARRRRAQVETITLKEDVKDEEVVSEEPKKDDRSLIKQRALEYRNREELNGNPPVDESEEEENDSSSDDDGYIQDELHQEDSSAFIMAKPVFIPRDKRKTQLEKEQMKLEEQHRAEMEKELEMERKKQSKELLIKKLTESQVKDDDEEDEELIDDTDTFDEKEYELWKIRELKRMIRDAEEREAQRKLEAEIERRRNMTDEERERDNERIDANKVKVERGKMRFLQKYYHKGAFFMDKLDDKSEPLYARDFNAPTAEDCIDKSILPQPMRVRRGLYGKQGQVKHTHLVDVDTTQFDMPWTKPDKKFKLAGTRQVFDRPSKKKHH